VWVATHTPENGTWEPSKTPKNLERNCRGQNTSHWGVLYTVGKVLKCRCPKWPRMSHLDICSTSYGRKMGWESNWQFDSQPLKVGNWPDLGVCRWSATHLGKLSRRATTLLQTSSQSEVRVRNYERSKSQESKLGQFRDSTLGVLGKSAIWMQVRPWDAENTIWGRWWLPLSLGRGEPSESKVACGLSQHQECSEWALTNLLVGFGCRTE